MHFGSTAGRFTVTIPPFISMRKELRIIAHGAQAGRQGLVVDGKIQPVKDYEVTFKLTELNEGEWSKEGPALFTHFGNGDDDVRDFLRAVVNEAAHHGIYADNAGDVAKELGATREHLEDMRRLALGQKFVPRGSK